MGGLWPPIFLWNYIMAVKLLCEYDDKEIFEEAFRRKLFKIEKENAVVKVKKTVYEDDIQVIKRTREVYDYKNSNSEGFSTNRENTIDRPLKINYIDPITLYSSMIVNEDGYFKSPKRVGVSDQFLYKEMLYKMSNGFVDSIINKENIIQIDKVLEPNGLGIKYVGKLRVLPWSK